MEETISRKEHEEFAKRIDEENHRQNRRIEALEETVRQISDLTSKAIARLPFYFFLNKLYNNFRKEH